MRSSRKVRILSKCPGSAWDRLDCVFLVVTPDRGDHRCGSPSLFPLPSIEFLRFCRPMLSKIATLFWAPLNQCSKEHGSNSRHQRQGDNDDATSTNRSTAHTPPPALFLCRHACAGLPWRKSLGLCRGTDARLSYDPEHGRRLGPDFRHR